MCPDVMRLVADANESGEADKNEHDRHILRIRAQDFLSANGKNEDEAFEKQGRKKGREESSFPFIKPQLLPPQRLIKQLNTELNKETLDHLKGIF